MTRRLRNPISVGTAVLAVAGLALVAFERRQARASGEDGGPRLFLTADAATSPRMALLEGVAKPLERRLLSLPGAVRVESWTDDGRVRIEVEGAPGLDPDTFHLAALRRTEGLPLPPDRLVLTLLSAREPILQAVLRGGGSAARRGTFAREVVLPELARCRGAGQIEILGGPALRVAVTPLGAPLAAHGLTALDLAERLQALGRPLPAGRIRDGAAVRPLAVRERIASFPELGAVAIPGPRGSTPLSEVADLAPREVEDGSWYRWHGEEALLVRLFAAPGGEPSRCRREAVTALRRLAADARVAGFDLSPWAATDEEGRLVLRYELLGHPSPSELRRRSAALERDLSNGLAGLKATFVSSAYSADPERPAGGEPEAGAGRAGLRGRLEISFPGAAARREGWARLASRLRRIPDLQGWIEGPGGAAVEVSAQTEAEAEELAGRVRRALAEKAGVNPATEPAFQPRAALQLAWNQPLLLAARTDGAALAKQVRAALGEFLSGQVEIAGVEGELWIEPTRVGAPDLVPVRLPGSEVAVPLRALARLERRAAVPPLLRIDGRPAVRLELFAPRIPKAGIELGPVLDAIPLAPGERLRLLPSAARGD